VHLDEIILGLKEELKSIVYLIAVLWMFFRFVKLFMQQIALLARFFSLKKVTCRLINLFGQSSSF